MKLIKNNSDTNEFNMENQPKIKQRFYKKKWFWAIVIVILIIANIPDVENSAGKSVDTQKNSSVSSEETVTSNAVGVDEQENNSSSDKTKDVHEETKQNQDNSNSDVTGLDTLVSDVMKATVGNQDYVYMVKNAVPTDYPDITYGEAFANFFSNPKWKSFDADTGEQVVEFTGKCMYADNKVKAKIQFVLDQGNGTFEATYLDFNDVPQNMLMMDGLFSAVFEQ